MKRAILLSGLLLSSVSSEVLGISIKAGTCKKAGGVVFCFSHDTFQPKLLPDSTEQHKKKSKIDEDEGIGTNELDTEETGINEKFSGIRPLQKETGRKDLQENDEGIEPDIIHNKPQQRFNNTSDFSGSKKQEKSQNEPTVAPDIRTGKPIPAPRPSINNPTTPSFQTAPTPSPRLVIPTPVNPEDHEEFVRREEEASVERPSPSPIPFVKPNPSDGETSVFDDSTPMTEDGEISVFDDSTPMTADGETSVFDDSTPMTADGDTSVFSDSTPNTSDGDTSVFSDSTPNTSDGDTSVF